jgi:type I restriction enzyme R subunit
MITEDQLEQLAIRWFQDTGWNYVHGAVIAPEGVAVELEDFRAVVLKERLAEAVRRLNPTKLLPKLFACHLPPSCIAA